MGVRALFLQSNGAKPQRILGAADHLQGAQCMIPDFLSIRLRGFTYSCTLLCDCFTFHQGSAL